MYCTDLFLSRLCLKHLIHFKCGSPPFVLQKDKSIIIIVKGDGTSSQRAGAVLSDERTDPAEDSNTSLEVDNLVVVSLPQGHLTVILMHQFLVVFCEI